MAIPAFLTAIAGPILAIIDKFVPDKTQAEKLKFEFNKQLLEGNLTEIESKLKINLAQIEVNKMDAQNSRFWNSGWRPYIGWICGLGLTCQFIVFPIISLIMVNTGLEAIALPDFSPLVVLLGSLLGVAGLRSYEKIHLPRPFKDQ